MHSKLPETGTTIFTVMSQLAAEYNAINLGQGFPDFNMNDELIQLVCKSMKMGNNQYVHMNGLLKLRQSIAQKIERLYHTAVDAETQITITPGGTYAIYSALTAILQPGDEVIVFEPAYDSYIPNIEINQAKAIRITLPYPHFNIPWSEVKKKINHKTKALIINSPNNPTGSVLTPNDIDQLQQIVQQNKLYIISDEVYEHIIFNNLKHESMLRYPDLLEKSFVCFSFGKTYNCTGWKIGYCIAAKDMMKEFRKVHQFNSFSCNSFIQYALADFITREETYNTLGLFLQQKKEFFENEMMQTGFKPLPSYGSYFQCYSYENISWKKEKDFAIELSKKYGVATIPLSSFYKEGNDHKVLRFCFVKKEDTLAEAAKRLTSVH